MRVHLGFPAGRKGRGRAGFEAGVQGPLKEYRNNAIHGEGLRAGLTSEGQLFIEGGAKQPLSEATDLAGGLELRLAAEPSRGEYALVLSAHESETEEQIGRVQQAGIHGSALVGNVAVFADYEDDDYEDNEEAGLAWGEPRVWFQGWRAGGSNLEAHDERAFGPILFGQHTLSRGVMKMTAQMPPSAR